MIHLLLYSFFHILCILVLLLLIKYSFQHPCWSVVSLKLLCNFIETAFGFGCSLMKLLYIFRAAFYKNTLGKLLLHLFVIGKLVLLIYWKRQMSKYPAEKWMSFALYISVLYLYCIFILYICKCIFTHCRRLCKTTEIFVRIENVFFYLIFTQTHLVFGFLVFVYIFLFTGLRSNYFKRGIVCF